jgi:hypothetical protein
MADGTTYSQALQQILGQPSQPGVFGYGFSKDDINQLQQAGITQEQLMQMGLSTQPQTTTSAYQSGGGGSPTTSPSAGGIQQSNNAALLQAMLKLRGGQQQQGPPTPGNAYGQAYPMYAIDAQGNPTGKPVYANPTNQASLLGAAALGIGGGQSPVVINQPPSGTPSSVSGVAPTSGALIGSTQPTTGWNWDTLAHAAGMTSAQIAPYMKSGQTAAQVGQSLGLGSGATPGMTGPWTNAQIGSVFTPVTPTAPTKVTPLQGATQATATGYSPTATPFAQAPPAPGLQIPQTPFVAAHTDALADAGKALFAHFGGDPNSAGPADIANFHTQLTSALAGAPQPTAANLLGTRPTGQIPPPNPQAVAGLPGNLPGISGGVPAFGSAYGTPPPITVPPWQGGQAGTGTAVAGQGGLPPANIIGTTPSGPIPPPNPALAAAPQPTAAKKMASGGRVPGRGNKDTVPALLTPGEYVIPKPQVQQLMRTGRLPIKMAGGGSVQDPDPDPNAPPETRRKMLSAQTSQAQPPAAPGGSNIHPALTSGLAAAAQTYGSAMANFPKNPIGSGSGVDIRNTRLDPDPDLPSLKAAGMLGSGPGSGQPTASALGGIGSGLTQAAQAIASSVKPWQMQQSAIPAPPPAPAPVQFQQPQVAQQAQQAVNPYAAYAANQARYPTSPYYS